VYLVPLPVLVPRTCYTLYLGGELGSELDCELGSELGWEEGEMVVGEDEETLFDGEHIHSDSVRMSCRPGASLDRGGGCMIGCFTGWM
jgi:hypothetical protein